MAVATSLIVLATLLVWGCLSSLCLAALPHNITIDGSFEDWAPVPSNAGKGNSFYNNDHAC